MILANARLITMDDAGTEQERGWLRIEDGLIAELALPGCTTVFDHHHVFPRGRSEILEAELEAAAGLGVRPVASRGSMDLGESRGGLPPDELVEDLDAILADTERLAARGDVVVAPCSPFSVTRRFLEESAALARRLGLRLRTHLAETVEEEACCRELYGCSPVEYLAELGWLEPDVWLAHCVHRAGAPQAGGEVRAMISTHVLDTEAGEPAGGVKVALYRDRELVSLQETDEDGRIAELSDEPLEPGLYRLVFHVDTGFFERVELVVAIADPERHYHVPLLVSSYQCTAYRGS